MNRKIVVTHWFAADETGASALSYSSAEVGPGVCNEDLKKRVIDFCAQHPTYHMEVWTQIYWVSDSEWIRTG